MRKIIPYPTAPPELIGAIVDELRGTIRQLRCGTLERVVNLGVSMTQMHVLWLLEHHGVMPMSRLADLLEVSVSNSTGLIDRMEERGLVERTRANDDRRLVLVRVGPAGVRVLRELESMGHEQLRGALGHLHPARLRAVLHAFADLRSAIEADLGPVRHTHCSDDPAAAVHPGAPVAS